MGQPLTKYRNSIAINDTRFSLHMHRMDRMEYYIPVSSKAQQTRHSLRILLRNFSSTIGNTRSLTQFREDWANVPRRGCQAGLSTTILAGPQSSWRVFCWAKSIYSTALAFLRWEPRSRIWPIPWMVCWYGGNKNIKCKRTLPKCGSPCWRAITSVKFRRRQKSNRIFWVSESTLQEMTVSNFRGLIQLFNAGQTPAFFEDLRFTASGLSPAWVDSRRSQENSSFVYPWHAVCMLFLSCSSSL